MKKYLVVILGLLLAQCATSKIEEIYKTYNKADYLYWSEENKLTWEDFQGIPIETTNMNSESYFHNPSTVAKQNLFASTDVIVVCIFDRKSSWAIRDKVSENGLLYHQVLFDIFELYARKLRRDLTESDNTFFDFTEKYHQLSEKNNRLLIEETQRYRSETQNGLDKNAINVWSENIKKELENLKKYKMDSTI